MTIFSTETSLNHGVNVTLPDSPPRLQEGRGKNEWIWNKQCHEICYPIFYTSTQCVLFVPFFSLSLSRGRDLMMGNKTQLVTMVMDGPGWVLGNARGRVCLWEVNMSVITSSAVAFRPISVPSGAAGQECYFDMTFCTQIDACCWCVCVCGLNCAFQIRFPKHRLQQYARRRKVPPSIETRQWKFRKKTLSRGIVFRWQKGFYFSTR